MSEFSPSNFIILILFVTGIILLQVHLSKKEGKGLGLILPVLNFLFSVITVAGAAGYTRFEDENGEVTNTVLPFIGLFIYLNLATIIFLLIYFHYKKKKMKLSEIDKMNKQDLN